MNRGLLFLSLAGFTAVWAGAAEPRPGRTAGQSVLVEVRPEGALHYRAYSDRGDVLPDFSAAGYGGGGVPLPDAPVRRVVEVGPADEDASGRIQAALDEVANLAPDASGLRGAVLVRRGRHRLERPLRIAADGVVLRGEGDGEDGTVLVAAYRRQEPLIQIGGRRGPRATGRPVEIVDDYVPVGARQFRVADVRGLVVGQTVWVERRGNAAWITAIGMDQIVRRPENPGSTKQWEPFVLRFDRVITAIEGNSVTVDAPVTCAIERAWGGGAVVAYDDRERIVRCGVEHLRAESFFDPAKVAAYRGETVAVDEDHATHLVAFGAVKHGWARGLTAVHFYHGPATMEADAKWITVEDCRSLAPVSQITGGRRYPYNIEGQLVLVRRCYSDRARHAFVFGARVCGPNVFLDCRSENDYATSEPHHRWSVGGLYDNVEAQLAIQDRQWMGSGHGWSGANYVVWNGRGTLICQQPPTAQNFAIGFVGRRGRGAFPGRPAGWWESEGTPVAPRSLYEAQLAARGKAKGPVGDRP